MLIKKMTLDNFRQYNGRHEIEFSTDKERNVTLVMGDNGSGKTTIGQAFHWCLYGETPDFLKKESLLSSKVEKELYDNWSKPVCVTIYMEHAHKQYEIRRTSTFKNESGRIVQSKPSLSIFVTPESGERKTLQGKDLINCIEEILPKELSTYFFLSGEKIDSMSLDIRSGRSKDFAKAVNTLLDLDYYKSAIKHLNAVLKEYNTSSLSVSNSDVEKENRNIELCENNIETFRGRLEELHKSANYFDEKRTEIKAQLMNIVSSKEFEAKRQNAENKLNSAQTSIDIEVTSGLRNFIKNAPSFFTKIAVEDALKTLNEIAKIKTEEIPEKLHADLIDWIEAHETCICGCKVVEGNAQFDFLESWRNIVPPEAIGTLVKTEKAKMFSKFASGNDLYDNLEHINETIADKMDSIDELGEQIKALTEKIANAEDTSGLQRELTNAEEQLNIANNDIYECNRLIDSNENFKKESIKKRDVLMSENEEGKRILRWKKTTEMLIEGFERNLEKDEKEKREKLVKAVKESFERIYGTSFTIEIDEKYHIKTSTDLETSTGQGMSVIYAFLAGLLHVIKTAEKQEKIPADIEKEIGAEEEDSMELESYPLVLDAPFSALDKTRISSICAVLPKVSEQIIIFIKDTDGIEAKNEFGDKVGKCYKLIKQGNSDDDTIIQEEK